MVPMSETRVDDPVTHGMIPTSAIYSLPVELLSLIFVACWDIEKGSYGEPLTALSSAMALSQTCSLWRKLCFNIPLLWSRICIVHGRTQESLVSLWVERSHLHPLSVSYLGSSSEPSLDKRDRDRIYAIFDILASASERWRSIYLDCDYTHSSLVRLFANGAPHIEQCVLKLRQLHYSSLDVFNNLLNCPSLRSLEWGQSSLDSKFPDHQNIAYDRQFRQLVLPKQHHITRMSIQQELSASTVLRLLTQCCETIEYCQFYIREGLAPFSELHTMPLILPNMRSLELFQQDVSTYPTDTGIFPLLERLSCPRVSSIHISIGFCDVTNWFQPVLIPFLQRSACSLQELYLERTGITESDLINLLRVCSNSLLKMKIVDSSQSVSKQLLSLLNVNKKSALCPRLISIELRGCVGTSVGFEEIISMIRSRSGCLSFINAGLPLFLSASKAVQLDTLKTDMGEDCDIHIYQY